MNRSVYNSRFRVNAVSRVHFTIPSLSDFPPAGPILLSLLRLIKVNNCKTE